VERPARAAHNVHVIEYIHAPQETAP